MITLKEAFEDLANRLQKQLAEKIWEIKRIEEIKDKSEEWYMFAGAGAVKKEILKKSKQELKEREDNLKTITKIIKNHS